jgi:hypothetical protein
MEPGGLRQGNELAGRVGLGQIMNGKKHWGYSDWWLSNAKELKSNAEHTQALENTGQQGSIRYSAQQLSTTSYAKWIFGSFGSEQRTDY